MDDEKWRDPQHRIKPGETWRPSDDYKVPCRTEQNIGIAAAAASAIPFFIKNSDAQCAGVFYYID